jgi:endonuclease-3
MNPTSKIKAIIDYFTREPEIKTELHYQTPFQLLVAVVLSAQCTDKRVNLVTPDLFQAFPTPQDLAESTVEEVFPYIRSISYPNNKTKYLVQAAQQLVAKFGGEVPEDVTSLYQIAGVGRKSAHVIAAVLYNTPTLGVDTHVMRVSRRLGLIDEQANTPLAIEKQLLKVFPPEYAGKLNHWLVIHGRYTCLARNPKCGVCQLSAYCVYFKSHKLEGR